MAKMRAVQVSRANGPLELVMKDIPRATGGNIKNKSASLRGVPFRFIRQRRHVSRNRLSTAFQVMKLLVL